MTVLDPEDSWRTKSRGLDLEKAGFEPVPAAEWTILRPHDVRGEPGENFV